MYIKVSNSSQNTYHYKNGSHTFSWRAAQGQGQGHLVLGSLSYPHEGPQNWFYKKKKKKKKKPQIVSEYNPTPLKV